MLQLLYVSSARPGVPAVDLDAMLAQAQANNARRGVTGLLYTDGRRFLQVIEGEAHEIEATFARIAADPRHHAVVVLSRREIAAREFGAWAMARRALDETHDIFTARVAALCAQSDPAVLGTFAGLIEARRAA